MDVSKPFRCIYDPELSKSKSRGPKVLIQRPRLDEVATDPRPRHQLVSVHGKRAVPAGALPLPEFARSADRNTRCVIMGLSPLVSRSRLYDALTAYDRHVEIHIAVSQFTGASLGVAWAKFSSENYAQLQEFLRDCDHGRVNIDASVLRARSDKSGDEFAREVAETEVRLQREERAQEIAERELENARRQNELGPLELRELSPTQLSNWFSKYLSAKSTYIIIRKTSITPSPRVYQAVSEMFRDTNYHHVASNFTGTFVVYESERAALSALQKNYDRHLFGKHLLMGLTLSGERIRQSDVKKYARSGRLLELENRATSEEPLQSPHPREHERDTPTGELVIPEGVFTVAKATPPPEPVMRQIVEPERPRPAVKSEAKRIMGSIFSMKIKKVKTETPPKEEVVMEGEPIKPDEKHGIIPKEEDATKDASPAVRIFDEDDGLDIPALPVVGSAKISSMDAMRVIVPEPDFEALSTMLESLETNPLNQTVIENEILGNRRKARRQARRAVRGALPAAWMPEVGSLPFRFLPAKEYSGEVRQQYLPKQAAGQPMEVVESYMERQLAEEFPETEAAPTRGSLRENMSSRRMAKMGSTLLMGNDISRKTKPTRLARSAIHDWGLYAANLIPAHEFVIEYLGEKVRDEFEDASERNHLIAGEDSTYLFRSEAGDVVDATNRGNKARFINHSCDPNLYPQMRYFKDGDHIVLYSTREIQPDEELTFDYNFLPATREEDRVRCLCGTAKCRYWLY